MEYQKPEFDYILLEGNLDIITVSPGLTDPETPGGNGEGGGFGDYT